MMFKICYALLCWCTLVQAAGPFGYYQHARLVSDDCSVLQELCKDLLTEFFSDPVVNYDAGCVYHAQGEHELAYHCFDRAVRYGIDTQPQSFLEQAYFNMGNESVQLKNLQSALQAYTDVLRLHPGHKRAQHNADVVRQMLEKQEQQEQDHQRQEHEKNLKNKQKQQQQQEQHHSDSEDGESEPHDKNEDRQQQRQDSDKHQEDNGDRSDPSELEAGDYSKSDDPQDNIREDQNNDPQEPDQKQNGDDSTQEKQSPKQDVASEQDQFGNRQDQKKEQADIARDDMSGRSPQDISTAQQNATDGQKMELQSHDVVEPQAGEIYDEKTEALLAQVERYDTVQYKKMIREHVLQTMSGQYGQKNW
ncbi:hypothetical protein JW872_03350 [Candidatus Babeliales bacterium]|nr:hypothetical protein [Candidatus Babeliales bacterium]